MDPPVKRRSISTSCSVKYDYDALFEILMRLDPCDVFKCILVSKYWLSVITNHVFRTNYLKKISKNSHSKVVGLLMLESISITYGNEPGNQLLPTSNTGLSILKNSMPETDIGFFISKSPDGCLLLFKNFDLNTFHVFKPVSGSAPVQLPEPPVEYSDCKADVISSDDGEDFKVILARGILFDDCYVEDTKLSVQTFCSRTWKWEQSTLTCSTSFRLVSNCTLEGGTVTKGGLIYWEAGRCREPKNCLAVWDMNEGYLSVIPEPPFKNDRKSQFHTIYGVSPEDSLLAAKYSIHIYEDDYDWESVWFTINIWALDDGKKDWRLLYSVMHSSIWANNFALLTSLFEDMPKGGFRFQFLSFVLGKSDSGYLGLRQHLFIYHFRTGKLEYVEYLKYGFPIEKFRRCVSFHPSTVLDLGMWPTSPPSLQLPRCS